MELGHLLTRSGLTYPEVSSNVYHDSLCQLGSNPTTGLTLLWARNSFRGNFNHWRVSRKETGQTFFKLKLLYLHFLAFFCDVLLTVLHLSIFISEINQLDAQNFCFTISLFHASTCFEHMRSSSGGQNCITQHLVSSHRNK